MSNTDLKKKLILRIHKTKNKRLLLEVDRLIKTIEEDQDIVTLTSEQKKALTKSQKDIKSGKFYTNEELEKEIIEWLKK